MNLIKKHQRNYNIKPLLKFLLSKIEYCKRLHFDYLTCKRLQSYY